MNFLLLNSIKNKSRRVLFFGGLLCGFIVTIPFIFSMVSSTNYWEPKNIFKIPSIFMCTTPSSQIYGKGQESKGNNAELYDKVRVFCIIPTSPENHKTKAKAVKKTWGKRCNKLLFFSTQKDPQLKTIVVPDVFEGREWIWGKTRGAFEFVWENHREDADWFLKADDDSFVILENLRNYLKNFNSNEAYYVGYTIGGDPYNYEGYMYGAGYLLSRRTLERFIKEAAPNDTICEPGKPNLRPHYRGDEDVEMGRCLTGIGNVTKLDPRDEKGHVRLMGSSPEYQAETREFPETREAMERDGDTALSFHHLEAKHQYMLDYLIYRFRLHA